MRTGNYLMVGFAVVILTLAVTISCNRQFAVPVSAVVTPTTTAGNTGTPTNTPTSTATSTATNTNTVSGPTYTFTNTPTSTATNTATNTNVPGTTNTFTNTPTVTQTNTATSTATNTATVTPLATVYTLIDDFEQTGNGSDPGDDSYNIYKVTDEAGNLRDGSWFFSTDASSTGVTNFTSASAFAGTYAGECSGTLGVQASYSSFGFSFTNPGDAALPPTGNKGVSFYDATVGGRYKGIVFEIEAKNIVPCTGIQSVIVDMIDITAGGVVTDHQIAVPVTSTYQAVTIFYDQCLSSTGVALQPVSMYQVVFKAQSYGDTSFNYDYVVDNLSLTTTADPGPAATPLPNSVIDNFQNGLNQTQSPWLGAGVTAGFLSDDADGTSGALCPTYNFDAGSQPGFCLASPGPVQVVPGVPSFAAHMSDPNIDYGPPSYLGYCGMGFYFNNADGSGANTGTDISQGGAFSKLVFYAKSSNSTNVYVEMNDDVTYQDNCYAPSVNYYSITPGTTWTQYTIDFNSSDGTYNLGSPTLTTGTNGCGAGFSGAAHPYQYQNAEQIQWEPQGAAVVAIDLWVGDIYLQ